MAPRDYRGRTRDAFFLLASHALFASSDAVPIRRPVAQLAVSALVTESAGLGESPLAAEFHSEDGNTRHSGPKSDFDAWLQSKDEQNQPSQRESLIARWVEKWKEAIAEGDFTNILPKRRMVLWSTPIVIGLLSFVCYPAIATAFHALVVWSRGMSVESKDPQVRTLNVDIITQAINGPVIGAISILFGLLASMTVSTLYERQGTIRHTYDMECHSLRKLRLWMQRMTTAGSSNGPDYRTIGFELLQEYTLQLEHESRPVDSWAENTSLVTMRDSFARHAGDLHLMALLKWCQDLILHVTSKEEQEDELRQALLGLYSYSRTQSNSPSISRPSGLASKISASNLSYPPLEILHVMYGLVDTMLEKRTLRYLALTTVYPLVHWITLSVLAVSIALSFLIAADHTNTAFRASFPVRVLWSIITSTITALAVLCIDLSAPYNGAYQVFSGMN